VAKDKLTEYDATAANNTVVGDVNLAENSALPSDMNNAVREVMSHLKEFATGAESISGLTVAGNVSVDSGTIKLDGNYPTGSQNVAMGDTALDDGSLSGNANTAIGHAAMTANTSGSDNVGVGKNALLANTTGDDNVAVGKNNMDANSTGSNNTALGSGALTSNTTASNNTAAGYDALAANTTGASNTAVGWSSLKDNTTGANNAAFGQSALQENTTADNNSAFGYRALYQNTTGTQNVAVGGNAGDAITTGSQNTVIGYNAAGAMSTGTFNAFLGRSSGSTVTTGSKNTIIGSYNGNQDGLDIRTQNNQVIISDGDGNVRIRMNGSELICPGVNTDTTSNSANVAVLTSGSIRKSTSSLRYKNTVNDATHGLNELLTLRPVTFKGNNDGDKIFGGLIAEEIHDAGLTEFVQYDDDDRPDALAYGNMVSLCIKAIQELKTELDAAKARIATLEGE